MIGDDFQVRASEDVLLQSEVFVSVLSHSAGLGFSQTVALKPKSRLTGHHHDVWKQQNYISPPISHTHSTWAYKQPDC